MHWSLAAACVAAGIDAGAVAAMNSPRSLSSPQPPSCPGLSRRFPAWLRDRPLARDIAIILCIKFVLLMVIKYAFFNQPVARHMSLPPDVVAHQLLATPINPRSTQGDHDAR